MAAKGKIEPEKAPAEPDALAEIAPTVPPQAVAMIQKMAANDAQPDVKRCGLCRHWQRRNVRAAVGECNHKANYASVPPATTDMNVCSLWELIS